MDEEIKEKERKSLTNEVYSPIHKPQSHRRVSDYISMVNPRSNEDMSSRMGRLLNQVEEGKKNEERLSEELHIMHKKYKKVKDQLSSVIWGVLLTKCSNLYPDIPFTQKGMFESEVQLDRYRLGCPLGRGQFSIVRECSIEEDMGGRRSPPPDGDERNGKAYAIKMIRKDFVRSEDSLLCLQKELHSLKVLNHPNIVKFIEVLNSRNHLSIVTEKMDEDLFEFIGKDPSHFKHQTSGQLTANGEYLAKSIITSILLALQHCHRSKICHRDLKPENILIKQFITRVQGQDAVNITVKLADFGLSESLPSSFHKLKDFCGSPGFFAPEILLDDGGYDGKMCDIWSLGCIALEMLIPEEEFMTTWMVGAYDDVLFQRPKRFEVQLISALGTVKQSIGEAIQHARSSNHQLLHSGDEDCGSSSSCLDFCNKMLQPNPRQRFTSDKLVLHPWIVSLTAQQQVDMSERRPSQAPTFAVSPTRGGGDYSSPPSSSSSFSSGSNPQQGMGNKGTPHPITGRYDVMESSLTSGSEFTSSSLSGMSSMSISSSSPTPQLTSNYPPSSMSVSTASLTPNLTSPYNSLPPLHEKSEEDDN